jgi:hypothetical protein
VTKEAPPSDLQRVAARGGQRVLAARETAGTLAATYDLGSRPVVVLVHADGIVDGVVQDLTASPHLESRLSRLDQRGAEPATTSRKA